MPSSARSTLPRLRAVVVIGGVVVSEDDIFYSAFALLLRKIDPLIGISGAANLTPTEGSPR